jgi:hypothetical protein
MNTLKPRGEDVRAYLSGGMEHARNFGSGWRLRLQEWIEAELGHRVFNPSTVSEQYLKKHSPGVSQKRLKRTNLKEFQRLVSTLMRLDCEEIAKRTDYVVCLWDESAQKGAGTKGELTMAKYFGKPVYVVTAMEPAEIPGWILACTTRLFSDFEELKVFLKRRYAK